MAQRVNCIYVELDGQHADFNKLVQSLRNRGFSFYCYNKWTLKQIAFDPLNIPDKIDPSGIYTCTLDLEMSDYALVKFVIENDFHHGGCIKRYVINVAAE